MTDQLLPDIIAPEGLQIAETYLMLGGDSKKTASELGLAVTDIEEQLKKNEVKQYINRQFHEQGYRNKFRIFGVMDQLLNMKLEEIQESEIGTSMDVVDLIKVMHRMKMDEMKMEIEAAKVAAATGTPGKQTNIQNNINIAGNDDENYMALISRLTK